MMMYKKLATVTLSGILLLGACLPSMVGYATTLSSSENNYSEGDVFLTLSSEDYYRMHLMAKLDKVLSVSSNNHLYLTENDDYLKENYSLSEKDINTVKTIITQQNEQINEYKIQLQERVYVEDWHIHLSHDDVMQIGNLIAGLGPAAVIGVMSTFMSVVPGAGTILGAVVGFFGAGSIAGNVMYAAATGKGLKIGLTGISTE